MILEVAIAIRHIITATAIAVFVAKAQPPTALATRRGTTVTVVAVTVVMAVETAFQAAATASPTAARNVAIVLRCNAISVVNACVIVTIVTVAAATVLVIVVVAIADTSLLASTVLPQLASTVLPLAFCPSFVINQPLF